MTFFAEDPGFPKTLGSVKSNLQPCLPEAVISKQDTQLNIKIPTQENYEFIRLLTHGFFSIVSIFTEDVFFLKSPVKLKTPVLIRFNSQHLQSYLCMDIHVSWVTT